MSLESLSSKELVELLKKERIGGWGQIPCAIELGKRKEPKAVPPLVDMLSSPYAEMYSRAAEALSSIGAPSVKHLETALYRSGVSKEFAARIVNVLIRIDEPGSVKAVISAHRLFGKFASLSFFEPSNIKNPETISQLIKFLSHDLKSIRVGIVSTLTEIEDYRIIEAFYNRLRTEKEDYVRYLLYRGLVIKKSKKVVSYLIDELSNCSTNYSNLGKSRICELLTSITNEPFGEDREKWLSWWKERENSTNEESPGVETEDSIHEEFKSKNIALISCIICIALAVLAYNFIDGIHRWIIVIFLAVIAVATLLSYFRWQNNDDK